MKTLKYPQKGKSNEEAICTLMRKEWAEQAPKGSEKERETDQESKKESEVPNASSLGTTQSCKTQNEMSHTV